MPATKTQLTGGVFQDSEGNVLNAGYLLLKLNQDNTVSGVGNICSGIEVKILLNSSGSVDTITPQYVWATDVMTVANAFYTITGYTALGQRAWGPNNQQVLSSGIGGGTFDAGLWVPNQIYSWTPTGQPTVSLRTNGVPNSIQNVENLIAGGNITLTSDNAGGTTIAASSAPVVFPAILPTGTAIFGSGGPNLRTSGWILTAFAQGGLTLVDGPGTNTSPSFANCQVQSGLAGSGGNWHSSTSDLFPLGQVQTIRSKVRLNQTTNVRVWIGILTEVTGMITDLPNTNIAAFRYSTAAGDTKWQCITATDAAHATITPQSGTNLDTNFHTFEIQYSPTGPTVTFLIDGLVVGTSTTNLPTVGNLSYYIAIDNAGVAYQPTLDYAWTVCQANF